MLVDFTADWCVTCQFNKRTSLEIPTVRAKLKELNAVAFLGDYTRTPDAITTELNLFARAGVPLVLYIPKTPPPAHRVAGSIDARDRPRCAGPRRQVNFL